jgi:hypothetical protein
MIDLFANIPFDSIPFPNSNSSFAKKIIMNMKNVHETINIMRAKLPLERGNLPFIDALKLEFNSFIGLLEDTKMEDVDLNVSCIRYAKPKPTKKRFINLVKMIQNTIIEIIQLYHEGFSGDAYKGLRALLKHNRLMFGEKRYRYYELDDILINSFSRKMNLEHSKFYRMRISKNELHEQCELFHLPYTKRELVDSCRFSIQGYPCLYLGTSLDVCWKEIGRDVDHGEQIYASRFENNRGLVFIDLTIPGDIDMYDAYQFLVTYPFYLASLVKVRFPKAPFKPEYIIPQLLLQYVRAEEGLAGIIYSSTKDNEHKNDKYFNIVIPTRGFRNDEFCAYVRDVFPLSEVVPIDINRMTEMEQKLNRLPVSNLPILEQ